MIIKLNQLCQYFKQNISNFLNVLGFHSHLLRFKWVNYFLTVPHLNKVNKMSGCRERKIRHLSFPLLTMFKLIMFMFTLKNVIYIWALFSRKLCVHPGLVTETLLISLLYWWQMKLNQMTRVASRALLWNLI